MTCENNTLGLYFSGVSGFWGTLGFIWAVSCYKRFNLLNITMGVLLLFR